MAAQDIYHDDVRSALVKEGWTITHDPLRLRWGKKDYYVDLGAEEVIAAEMRRVMKSWRLACSRSCQLFATC